MTETAVFYEENCVIELDGFKMESGGAWVTESHAVVYCKEDMSVVQSWHGKELGKIISYTKWRRPVRSYVSTHLYQITVRMNGKLWTGRTAGGGMCATLRLKKGDK